MRGAAFAALALLLVGCERGEEPQPLPVPPTPEPISAQGAFAAQTTGLPSA